MKRIGFLSDHWDHGLVLQALQSLEHPDEYHLETIDDFRRVESVAQAVWGLINLVDVLVAHITKDSRNLYYEIGLAHGAGKPVIVVADKSVSLPADVLGQRIISIDPYDHPVGNLTFLIREAIEDADRRGRLYTGYRGPRERTDQYPRSEHATPVIDDFRALFSYEGAARGARFERWFVDAARAVPGWEVIESERPYGHSDGFDFVIWNSREDSELSALGNPIAIELKAIRSMNAVMLTDFLHRARVSGLKAVVLATTGKNDQRTRKLLSRLRKDERINAIALDRDDLIQVSHPEDLVFLFKQKIRELLYEGEF
ncbi:hypothetical protein [Burkholderia sp. BCC0419]|uniref:hypothetical protein n=1 Tax=Burkholderia sp. BCC0419 TaxID=486878 RepID=UPI00158B0E7F|nr:hypothetical protein [Burkholderia sp. BCC0419]